MRRDFHTNWRDDYFHFTESCQRVVRPGQLHRGRPLPRVWRGRQILPGLMTTRNFFTSRAAARSYRGVGSGGGDDFCFLAALYLHILRMLWRLVIIDSSILFWHFQTFWNFWAGIWTFLAQLWNSTYRFIFLPSAQKLGLILVQSQLQETFAF